MSEVPEHEAPLPEQSGLDEAPEADLRTSELLIRSASGARAGWEAAFRTMAACGDDLVHVDDSVETAWDEEWQW